MLLQRCVATSNDPTVLFVSSPPSAYRCYTQLRWHPAAKLQSDTSQSWNSTAFLIRSGTSTPSLPSYVKCAFLSRRKHPIFGHFRRCKNQILTWGTLFVPSVCSILAIRCPVLRLHGSFTDSTSDFSTPHSLVGPFVYTSPVVHVIAVDDCRV